MPTMPIRFATGSCRASGNCADELSSLEWHERDHGPGHSVRVLKEFLDKTPKDRIVEADAEGAELPEEKIYNIRGQV